MRIIHTSDLSPRDKAKLMMRSQAVILEYVDKVRHIVEDVRERGDEAIVKHVEKLDGVKLSLDRLEVSDEDFKRAEEKISPSLLRAMKHAIENLRRFHREQLPKKMWFTEVEEGIHVGLQASPLARVGLYIPAGKGKFPSVVPMLGVPAKVAGVKEVILCTPPVDGFGDPATLVAAKLLGIDRVFRVGGVPAIAAMAFGTQTIPRVDKIVGPGGPYVSAAKILVRDHVALGTPAGPSEVMVLADESADPRIVAAEILSETEHGPDSPGILVTTSRRVAEEVSREIEALLPLIPEWRRGFAVEALGKYGAIIVCKDMEEAIEFINEYSPEHLLILTADPLGICVRVRSAGAVFLGPYSSVSAGCYLTGSNAILPTGGSGKAYSATTVYDFLRFQCVEFVDVKGLKHVLEDLEVYANYEGFP
ncbi:MAG: histidinol dehydrogenase, partial [Candidatus Bathyarchaeia archaeon]